MNTPLSALCARLRLTPDESVRREAADNLERQAAELRRLREEVRRYHAAVVGAQRHLAGAPKSAQGGAQGPRKAGRTVRGGGLGVGVVESGA